MEQLVGQTCVNCGGRIAAEFDAGFCRTCGLPTHERCVRRGGDPTGGSCRACGAPPAAREAAREADTRRVSAAQVAHREADRSRSFLVGLALLFGGLFATLLCAGTLSGTGRVVVFTGAILAGAGLVARGLWLARRD